MRAPAPAKINLALVVGPLRDDGKHELVTVYQRVGMSDRIDLTPAAQLRVDGFPGDTLVREALEALAARAGVEPRWHATIEKRLPVAAGLGGGSADAAATILALDELHGTGLPTETLLGIAAAVGSDVPALLLGGPVYADGRGDRVTPVHAQTTHWVVVPASFAVRTPDAYGWWDARSETGPDAGAVIAALEAGNDEILGPAIFNDLQFAVAARHPEVSDTIAALMDAGALGAVMSGSGPTVVALARHMAHADQIADAVPGAFVTSGPPRTMGPPSGVV